jgi:hypothetical protein
LKSHKNYYGKGKIQLNLDYPEDFITQVMESTSKYDPNIIRNQLKTIKMFQIVIKCLMKVIENYVLPILPEKFCVIFELKKETTLKTLKEFKIDFQNQDIDLVKKNYKKTHNEIYKSIFRALNTIEKFRQFNNIFSLTYQCFSVLKRETVINLTKYKLTVHDRCNCNYNSDLDKFISTNFPVNKICFNITKKLTSQSLFHNISQQYYEIYLPLYNYITSEHPNRLLLKEY